jgi:eukaryotic-like serine/threonine-protein kinase
MTTPNDPTLPDDALDAVIAGYLDAVDAGQARDRQKLFDQYPQHAEALRSFFANHDQMDAAAVELRLGRASDSTDTGGEGAGPLARIRYFGDYELLEEIARGGMGIVYKARQVSLNRIVALKMILAGQFASETEVERFYTEARAAANLQHRNIVAIHEVGRHENQHYFSMDYIEGKSLARIVRENPLPVEKAARYLKTIAEAIDFAHRQGTLHRDLKPSNVLIDRFDEPQITDFGLAKRIEGAAEITATGSLMGTPSYMPPEQAGAYDGKVSPASDVYSLGALLYDLVTGRPPFLGENLVVMLNQVLNNDPVAPRLLNPKVPRDLETICLKCLEKDPHKRYTSAAVLAADLDRFLRGEPIAARPVGQGERAWRWCQRNRLVSSLGASIAALLIVSAMGGSVLALRERNARTTSDRNAKLASEEAGRAAEAADRANANAAEARQSLDRLSVDEGLRLADEGNLYEALRFFVRPLAHARQMPPTEERMHRVRIGTYLRYTPGLPWLTQMFFPTDKPIDVLKFSPDSSRLLAVSGKDLWVWDLASRKLAGPPLHNSNTIADVAFSSDGKRLRIADGTIAWTSDYATGRNVGAAISDARLIAVSAMSKKGHQNTVLMQFSGDGTRLAIAANQSCRVWDVEKAAPLSPPIKCQYPWRRTTPDRLRSALTVGASRVAKITKKFSCGTQLLEL